MTVIWHTKPLKGVLIQTLKYLGCKGMPITTGCTMIARRSNTRKSKTIGVSRFQDLQTRRVVQIGILVVRCNE